MFVSSYFSYPKTQQNANHFENWNCSICHEEDPDIEGGTVAHGSYEDVEKKINIEGTKHPIHRNCIFKWVQEQSSCPNCKIDIDISKITPSLQKLQMAAKKTLNYLNNLSKKPTTWLCTGFPFICTGQLLGPAILNVIGAACQFRGIHISLQTGDEVVLLSRQINKLASEIEKDLDNSTHEQMRNKIDDLKRLMAPHVRLIGHNNQLYAFLDSQEKAFILDGLRGVKNIVNRDLSIDKFLRCWRVGSLIFGSYYGYNCIRSSL